MALVVVLPIPSWLAWEKWRGHRLHKFCSEALAEMSTGRGMSVTDLLRLERSHGIDSSYIVGEARFPAKNRYLTFGAVSVERECAISHDGTNVTGVQIF
jgi:hypothetical protein